MTPYSEGSEEPWGKANPRRGLGFVDEAVTFGRRHPLGMSISEEVLDAFAQEHGRYVAPAETDKHSDAWVATTKRRHIYKEGLNKAASHPRMLTFGISPYALKAMPGGGYRVMSPHDSVLEYDLCMKTVSLVLTKKKQLNYLLQAYPWHENPERAMDLENLYDDVQGLETSVIEQAARLSRKFDRLAAKFRLTLPPPEILQGYLEGPEDSPEADDASERLAP